MEHSMTTKFCKRHYECIAKVVQDLCLSHDEHDVCGLQDIECLRQSIASDFAAMFKADNAAFQRERFLRACQPGSNVRARS
jgi:hypothetical protein